MVYFSYFLMTLLMFSGLFLIGLILLQRGRGGGLAGAFGGMGGQSAFGTKAGDVFTRITIGVASAWILLCAGSVVALHNSSDLRADKGIFKAEQPADALKKAPAKDADKDENPLDVGNMPEPKGDVKKAEPANADKAEDKKPEDKKPEDKKPAESDKPAAPADAPEKPAADKPAEEKPKADDAPKAKDEADKPAEPKADAPKEAKPE